jgi:hypothetical protein
MRPFSHFWSALAVAAMVAVMVPATGNAMSRSLLVDSFDHTRQIDRHLSQHNRTFGRDRRAPGAGLGSVRRGAARDLVTSIYERVGVDRDLLQPRVVSPH